MVMKKKKPLFECGQDWTFELLEKTWVEIARIADEDLKLDYYKPQLEVISSEQMLDCYAATGLPIMYKHWSFGKEFLRNHKAYKEGQMGLAYEIVINSDPCIAYLMEENNMTMQCLVMAHASAGHSAVFKGNKMFKQFTDAGAIIDYLLFAKNYLSMCEEKYGEAEVESVLDSCHALMDYGVDRYTRRGKVSAAEEQKRAIARLEQQRIDYDPIWDKTVPKKDASEKEDKWPPEPEDNILYFIEKYAPDLPSWKREVIRIIRKISQYFYPQSQTKVLNEGFATFTHYYIMDKMYKEGLITSGSWLEFITSHTGVVFQPDFDKKYFSGMNPYALGFAIFMDLKRMCEAPTDEDRQWFPSIAGNSDWLSVVKDAMENYKDDTFIQQFMSPKVMRDFRLFAVKDDADSDYVEISAIHNDQGYIDIRNAMADSYNRGNWVPDIQVDEVHVLGDRTLFLKHTPYLGRPLHDGLAKETIAHVANLWEFDVVIETHDDVGNVDIEYLAHGPKKVSNKPMFK